jgi:hypothetical protein
MEDDHAKRMIHLFRRNPVLDMSAILKAFPDRSRCSIFRDLKEIGYLSSYNQSGQFFTLTDLPRFDSDGLWQHQGVFFSRHGNLKATVTHLVRTADAGKTHHELKDLLHVRVHNTLLDLVRQNEIAREELDKLFLYVHVDFKVRAEQIAKRREQDQIEHRPLPLGPFEIIEVLLDVIHHGEQKPEGIVAHLRAKGIGVTFEQVLKIFACYDLGKKNSPSRP